MVHTHTLIQKISSQAYTLDLPSNIKVHPVFFIGLLKELNSASPESKVPDDIPTSNDFFNGDDAFHVHFIVDHKIDPHPQIYVYGPALKKKGKWEGCDSSEDSWEPYANIKRMDCFIDYLKSSDKF